MWAIEETHTMAPKKKAKNKPAKKSQRAAEIERARKAAPKPAAPAAPVVKKLQVIVNGVAINHLATDIIHYPTPKTKKDKDVTVFKDCPRYEVIQGIKLLASYRASSLDGWCFLD